MESVSSKFAYETHQTMEDFSVKLSFSGDFTSDLITMLLLMARSNIGQRAVMKKVYNIMMESLENLTKHAAKNNDTKNPAIFLLGKDDHFYFLATGNRIPTKEVDGLKKKLDSINNLDKQGLRDLYNKVLTSGEGLTDRGGAGLGIIDMAMKSGFPFVYEFLEIDEEFSFFNLKIKVEDKN